MQKTDVEAHKYFSTAPPTLSVPVYYYSVHMEDNAASRVAHVLDVSIGFMDAMIDANLSLTRKTTALLQAIARLSDETTGDDIDPTQLRALQCCASNQYEKETKEMNRVDNGMKSSDSDRAGRRSEGDYVEPSNVSVDGIPASLHAPMVSLIESYDWVASMMSDKSRSETGDDARRLMDGNKGLPGVLVHCTKGVSRSPSVVMAYYMHKFTAELCANKSFSFLSLLQCLREARPAVSPQVCFIAELKSMWSRLAQNVLESNNESVEVYAKKTSSD